MIGYTKLIALFILGILFSGCATHNASLGVYSQPEGAFISKAVSGEPLGIAPITLEYDPASLNSFKDAECCFMVRGFEARWVSGATTRLNPIRLCGTETGSYTINLDRNMAYPRLEKDLQFVIQLRMVRAQQQATQNSAITALWRTWENLLIQ